MRFHLLSQPSLFLCCLGLASCSLPSLVQAQQLWPSTAEYQQVQEKGRLTWSLDVENDSMLLKKDDGFYTSGIHLQRKNVLISETQVLSYRWQLGQDLYTASDIKLKPSQLQKQDHPYAGWLYLGVAKELFKNDGSATSVGLDIGCLGACAGGEWTQTNLHRALNQPLPQAWNTQLKQEWGAVAKMAYSPARIQLNSNVDLNTQWQARFGNIFTDASVDLSVRLGQLNALPTQAASYLQLRTGARAVAYNASIQGGFFRHQDLAVSPKRLVPEAELAYVYQGTEWRFYASVIRRGNEIAELSNAKGAQNFAKVQLDFSY